MLNQFNALTKAYDELRDASFNALHGSEEGVANVKRLYEAHRAEQIRNGGSDD